MHHFTVRYSIIVIALLLWYHHGIAPCRTFASFSSHDPFIIIAPSWHCTINQDLVGAIVNYVALSGFHNWLILLSYAKRNVHRLWKLIVPRVFPSLSCWTIFSSNDFLCFLAGFPDVLFIVTTSFLCHPKQLNAKVTESLFLFSPIASKKRRLQLATMSELKWGYEFKCI